MAADAAREVTALALAEASVEALSFALNEAVDLGCAVAADEEEVAAPAAEAGAGAFKFGLNDFEFKARFAVELAVWGAGVGFSASGPVLAQAARRRSLHRRLGFGEGCDFKATEAAESSIDPIPSSQG